MWHKYVTALLLLLAAPTWGAEYAKGRDAYDSGDYETALSEWQTLAESGDADAQFGMGLLYSNGFGVPLDDDEALKWYKLAADQDHGMAANNLGVMYANGWGVPQSDEEAFRWYSLAAEHGVIDAQIVLAERFASGFGVTPDNVQAHKWLGIAAALGDLDAENRRDDIASRMTADEIAEAERLANAWLQEHEKLVTNQ